MSDIWTWLQSAEWMDDAACGGMESDIFFDEDRIEEARSVCKGCMVRKDCRKFAFEQRLYGDETGVYDGTTPTNRRSIARQLRAKRQAERES